jgi:hypothetical protein
MTAVCVICRLEEPLDRMRPIGASWVCTDAAACFDRFAADREHEDMQAGDHPDGF